MKIFFLNLKVLKSKTKDLSAFWLIAIALVVSFSNSAEATTNAAASGVSSAVSTGAAEAKTQVSQDEPHVKKGVLRVRMSAWPRALNIYTSNDVYTTAVGRFVHASLIDRNLETWEAVPMLAEKWDISKDYRTLTFYLNPRATFASGNPVTAEDVKFTFDLIYDQKRCVTCEPTRATIGPLENVTVLDSRRVQITTKNIHYLNLFNLGTTPILEKKVFDQGVFMKDFERRLEGAGPYIYDAKESTMRGRIVLRLREDNWLSSIPYFAKRFNFKKIIFKYIEDDAVAFEAFKRKDLDLLYFENPQMKFWDAKDRAPFTSPELMRLEADKVVPWSWGGIALNMRSGVTSDLRFRKALQFMLNRELFVTKLYKGHQAPVSGPFAKGSPSSSNSPAVPFDLEMAKKLLKEAGFTKSDDRGILYREVNQGGKTEKQFAEFTVIYGTKAHDQWLTVWKDDAKKVGVEITPRLMDWSAATKLLDEFKFQGFVIGWGGSPDPEPRQLWHSSGANQNGSSNAPGFASSRVDTLMDQAQTIFDREKRDGIYREMEKLIIAEQPYVFRWTMVKHHVAYWNDRVNPGKTPFLQYSGDDHQFIFYTHWTSAKE